MMAKTKVVVRYQECPICGKPGNIKISSQNGSHWETYKHTGKGCSARYKTR